MRKRPTNQEGFTLIEIILVVVISMILLGISIPHFAHSFKGAKLRSAARLVVRIGGYARNMAILRDEPMVMGLDEDSMELFVGPLAPPARTNEADGELDQDVLKRLGYVDGDAQETERLTREARYLLPNALEVESFEKEFAEDDPDSPLRLVRYWPDGRSEGFVLKLRDPSGGGIQLENDPISGKIHVEFVP